MQLHWLKGRIELVKSELVQRLEEICSVQQRGQQQAEVQIKALQQEVTGLMQTTHQMGTMINRQKQLLLQAQAPAPNQNKTPSPEPGTAAARTAPTDTGELDQMEIDSGHRGNLYNSRFATLEPEAEPEEQKAHYAPQPAQAKTRQGKHRVCENSTSKCGEFSSSVCRCIEAELN